MAWNASQLFWDQQVLLLWILLPPVFVACGFLTLFVPPCLARRQKTEAELSDVIAGAATVKRPA